MAIVKESFARCCNSKYERYTSKSNRGICSQAGVGYKIKSIVKNAAQALGKLDFTIL